MSNSNSDVVLVAGGAGGLALLWWLLRRKYPVPANELSGTYNVLAIPEVALTLSTVGNGYTVPATGTYNYPKDSVVDIEAVPDSGWSFAGWTGDVADPSSSITTVTMDMDKTVTASFAYTPIAYPITGAYGYTSVMNTGTSFFATERYWLFYYLQYTTADSYADEIWYTSSADKTTWATPAQAMPTDGDRYGIALDGDKIHICVRATNSYSVFYRMGTLASNGTITWAAGKQTVFTLNSNFRTEDCSIALDFNGYPTVISAFNASGMGSSAHKHIYAHTSTTKNGTWTTGTTTSLFQGDVLSPASGFCALTNGGSNTMLAVWNQGASLYAANRNTSGVWSTPSLIGTESQVNNNLGHWGIAGDSTSGNTYIAWFDAANNIQWVNYDVLGGTGVTDALEIAANPDANAFICLTLAGTDGSQYIIWEEAPGWYYKKRTGTSTWGNNTLWYNYPVFPAWSCPESIIDDELWLIECTGDDALHPSLNFVT